MADPAIEAAADDEEYVRALLRALDDPIMQHEAYGLAMNFSAAQPGDRTAESMREGVEG